MRVQTVSGKRECRVPGCGKVPFLRRLDSYRFRDEQFAVEPKVVLFDRAARYLAPLPEIEFDIDGTRHILRPDPDAASAHPFGAV